MSGNKYFRKKNREEWGGIRMRVFEAQSESYAKDRKRKFRKNTDVISKQILSDLYLKNGKSMKEIAETLNFSHHKVAYWMEKYKISRRSKSDATYTKRNPNGDPFLFQPSNTVEEGILFGLGLGIYWGEGTKSDLGSVRVGNTDPDLLKIFIQFIEKIHGIKREKIHFGLQIFSDISPSDAVLFWSKKLNIKKSQFQKTIVVTPSRGRGTYKKKMKYGVLTVYVHNKKLRNALIQEIENLRT